MFCLVITVLSYQSSVICDRVVDHIWPWSLILTICTVICWGSHCSKRYYERSWRSSTQWHSCLRYLLCTAYVYTAWLADVWWKCFPSVWPWKNTQISDFEARGSQRVTVTVTEQRHELKQSKTFSQSSSIINSYCKEREGGRRRGKRRRGEELEMLLNMEDISASGEMRSYLLKRLIRQICLISFGWHRPSKFDANQIQTDSRGSRQTDATIFLC